MQPVGVRVTIREGDELLLNIRAKTYKIRLKRPVVIREFFARLNIAFRPGNHLVFSVHLPAFCIGSVRMIKKAGIVRAQNILVA
jgi:hypothetical protein